MEKHLQKAVGRWRKASRNSSNRSPNSFPLPPYRSLKTPVIQDSRKKTQYALKRLVHPPNMMQIISLSPQPLLTIPLCIFLKLTTTALRCSNASTIAHLTFNAVSHLLCLGSLAAAAPPTSVTQYKTPVISPQHSECGQSLLLIASANCSNDTASAGALADPAGSVDSGFLLTKLSAYKMPARRHAS